MAPKVLSDLPACLPHEAVYIPGRQGPGHLSIPRAVCTARHVGAPGECWEDQDCWGRNGFVLKRDQGHTGEGTSGEVNVGSLE